jgi:HAE1 family hydrophobic/amphiphilic exporter-1
MQWLAALCVRHPVFTWVLMATIVVVGLASYGSLGLDEFPKVDVPIVLVKTELEGAAPEEVESELAEKIEGALNTISGIDELRSSSVQGVSLVTVAFDLDKDIDVAAQEVRDHLHAVQPELPKGSDPVVVKLDPAALPVLLVTLRAEVGGMSVRDLTELADKKVRRQIESIDGVGQVNIIGGRKREIRLWLDPTKLQGAGITAIEVQRALLTQNTEVPGGSIDTGPRRIALRVEGRAPSVAEIGRIIVREQKGHATRIEDLARVEDGEEDEKTWAAVNGAQTLVLSIRKQSGENTVAVVDAVRAKLDELGPQLPGIKLEIVRDNSQAIRTSLDAVREHLIIGALLAALVVLLFLGNVRSTLIAALSIPVSIIGTFALMKAIGFTLNIITLLALALAVGIVIDDAIVVLENIVRFLEEKRMKPFVAAVLATREIGLAVLATTLSLMAVFLPVAFMSGIIGRFMNSLGVTMAFAVAVSLLVSFSLTPMLSARWLKTPPPLSGTIGDDGQLVVLRSGLERVVDRVYLPIERLYLRLLRWVMEHRFVVVIACALALGSIVPLAMYLPKAFLPDNDLGELEIDVRAAEGTSLLQTRILGEEVATLVRTLPGVEYTLLTVGNDFQNTQNLANVYVRLSDPTRRWTTQRDIIEQARALLNARYQGSLRLQVSPSLLIATSDSKAQVQYTLTGPDFDKLTEEAAQVVSKLRDVPGAVDVDSSFVSGSPELKVSVNRDMAANLGVAMVDVEETIRLLVGGRTVSTYQEKGEDYDIKARAELKYRQDDTGLGLMTVPTLAGTTIPLATMLTVTPTTGPSQIDRLDRQRQITVTANVAKGYSQSKVSEALEAIIADQHLPPGYGARPAGLTKETGRVVHGFLIALGLSAVFMYLVLAAQFESWLHPATILLTLPLTLPFALISLVLFGQELTVMSALGVIVLFGVVKKNAILQVEHMNQLREQGVPRDEAILQANKDRLRPILMTTIAFVAGMIPLLVSRKIGSGLNRGIAGVIVGGQTFSLGLTLLATPVAYSLFDDLLRRRASRRTAILRDRGERDLDAL